MNKNITIRRATPSDAAALLDIYAPYVRDTAITFEYEVPSLDEFRARIQHTLETHPYLVAESNDTIVGYAYASRFHPRAAYDWSAEASIYVSMKHQKQGIGGTLYTALEEILKDMNIYNVNACIAYPETDDEYLTSNSVDYHTHLGYTLVGKFHNCGYKFGRWYHMVWMEKMLGTHPASPPKVIPYSELISHT